MPGDTIADGPRSLMRSVLQRIATGPELSKDISREEARGAMAAILNRSVDPVQAGVFLIALRMKRETDDENLGILEAVREVVHSVVADVDDVVDIADPFNGFNRNLPLSAFLPCVLAACGLPALCHGLERVGPKNGATARMTLAAAGAGVDFDSEQAATRLADPGIGWSYVDQRAYAPALHDLVPLRDQIVKRPALTTVEVMSGPLRGRARTHLVTGYVHKPYPRIYALLARAAGFDSLLLVRGIEGGVIPSLRQQGKVWQYHALGDEREVDIEPGACGIDQELRAAALPEGVVGYRRKTDSGDGGVDAQAIAEAAAQAGLDALAGAAGAARDSLVFAGALILWHVGYRESLASAADQVRQALDSGAVRRRFEA